VTRVLPPTHRRPLKDASSAAKSALAAAERRRLPHPGRSGRCCGRLVAYGGGRGGQGPRRPRTAPDCRHMAWLFLPGRRPAGSFWSRVNTKRINSRDNTHAARLFLALYDSFVQESSHARVSAGWEFFTRCAMQFVISLMLDN
jgi:hypothetical protein